MYFYLLAYMSPLLRNDIQDRVVSDFTSSSIARGI